MSPDDFSRRDFHRWATAAFGGLMAGSVAGCSDGKTDPQGAKPGEKSVASAEIHVCRGLNECKGLGAGGKNECAGQGACATAAAHSCGGENQCRNQGGCGQTPGFNECKGQGGCGVPMRGSMWAKARKHFEARMAKANKPVGKPPEEPPRKKENSADPAATAPATTDSPEKGSTEPAAPQS